MNFKHIPFIFCITILAIAVNACRTDETTFVLEENAPLQSMKDATIQYTDSGLLQMIMWGEEIQNFDDEDETQEFPKKVKATFYDAGEITVVITADEGTNWQKKKLMNLRKNVVIKDLRAGKTTYTEDFFWDQDKRIIYGNVPVLQIDSYGNRIRGIGFESDEEMIRFRLIKPVIDINY